MTKKLGSLMTQTSVNVKRRRSTDLLKHISEALLLFLADGWVAPTTVSAPHYLKICLSNLFPVLYHHRCIPLGSTRFRKCHLGKTSEAVMQKYGTISHLRFYWPSSRSHLHSTAAIAVPCQDLLSSYLLQDAGWPILKEKKINLVNIP